MLNLEPLGLRRLRFDLVMYYKILHGVCLLMFLVILLITLRQFLLIIEALNWLSLTNATMFYTIFYNTAADSRNNSLHTVRFCD
jgi:hypothetical protein